MRKEETNGIGKERTVETLDMTLREMAMCPGARKDKGTDGREMFDVFFMLHIIASLHLDCP